MLWPCQEGPNMTPTTSDAVFDQAAELARDTDPATVDAVAALLTTAGDDLRALEVARDRYVTQLHSHRDDWSATGALTLLNKALADVHRTDPLDWKQRWAKHRKP